MGWIERSSSGVWGGLELWLKKREDFKIISKEKRGTISQYPESHFSFSFHSGMSSSGKCKMYFSSSFCLNFIYQCCCCCCVSLLPLLLLLLYMLLWALLFLLLCVCYCVCVLVCVVALHVCCGFCCSCCCWWAMHVLLWLLFGHTMNLFTPFFYFMCCFFSSHCCEWSIKRATLVSTRSKNQKK